MQKKLTLVGRVTPAEFLDLTPERKATIKRARIVPPKLGKPGFGHIEVTARSGGRYGEPK